MFNHPLWYVIGLACLLVVMALASGCAMTLDGYYMRYAIDKCHAAGGTPSFREDANSRIFDCRR